MEEGNRFFDNLNKFQRMMFIDDIERFPSQRLALDLEEFTYLFGEPTESDSEILSELLIKDYLKIMDLSNLDSLADKWGLDWISFILEYNESREEYELCAVLRDVLNDLKTEPINTMEHGE